jgi:hypothetical protein
MATIIVRPSRVQQGRSASQRLFLTLANAGWSDGGTTFTISGVSGVSKVGQIVDSPTQAYVVITTTGAPLGHTAQTLTVSDGTNTGTTSVAPVAPTRHRWFPGLNRRQRRLNEE